MVRLLSSATALLGIAAAASVSHQHGSSAQKSSAQIRDTLRNLLRSIDDNGHDADSLFGKRQQWCDNTIRTFDAAAQAASTSLQDMEAQLTETEAEVEEAEGTVQQVKVDIEMVKHTIKQTEDMIKERISEKGQTADTRLLNSLVENKQMSLASLQGELEVAVPVLAQLQASNAETKQRISYRADSSSVAKGFIAAIRDDCQAGSDRADAQAAARVAETNSIRVALQALEDMGDADVAKAVKGEDVQEASPVSFVQVAGATQDVTADDLSDLFAADQAAHPAMPQRRRAPELPQEPSYIATAPSLRPRIQTLLNQLKHSANTASRSDQAAWCSKQRESSAMALKFAQDSVAQINSELDAHADAEAEFGSDLEKMQALSAAVTESAKTSLEQASKENRLVQSSRKDQELATKILDQATTILKELGASTSTNAISGLESAKRVLAKQIKAAANFQRQASAKAKSVGERAMEFTTAQESEQHNLEYARDDHTAQRLRGAENKRLYEADATEAAAYVQKLAESCKATVEAEVRQQSSAQVHALEDANTALEGKLVEAKSPASSLRGVDSNTPKPVPQNLTPMQRAAAEMGVSLD